MHHETTGRRGRRTPWLGLVLVMAVVASGCTGGAWGQGRHRRRRPRPGHRACERAGGCSCGSRRARPRPRPRRPSRSSTALPLAQDRIDAVVDRLPPFEEAEGDREEFNRPAETLPPPVAGETVATAFPPADGGDLPPDVSDGPLEVVRFQPDGEVAIAPSLVHHVQPADDPAGHAGAARRGGRPRRRHARAARPVALDRHAHPALRAHLRRSSTGCRWRPSTRSRCRPAPRRRRAATLADAVTFTFATPAPVVQALQPQHDSLTLEPVFVAAFDQRVDPQAVLDRVVLDANGARAVRLATDAEVEADDEARIAVSTALEGRWVAFRPVDPLPADTPLTVTFGAGTPSAEGPRTTTGDQVFRGRTFPPLAIVGTDCGYGDGCHPGDQWRINFSNPLDAAAFDPASVTIDPPIPGVSVGVSGTDLYLNGASEADTSYRVTIPAELQRRAGPGPGRRRDPRVRRR